MGERELAEATLLSLPPSLASAATTAAATAQQCFDAVFLPRWICCPFFCTAAATARLSFLFLQRSARLVVISRAICTALCFFRVAFSTGFSMACVPWAKVQREGECARIFCD